MPIMASNQSGDFEKAPTGMQQAVCAFVFDIGLQRGQWQGTELIQHKIIVVWELSETMTQGELAGKRFMVSKYYTLSLGDKANLRKDLESWRGKPFSEAELQGFDVENLVGANCFLNITATDKDKRKIVAVVPLPKNVQSMQPIATEPTPKMVEWINRERAKAVSPESVSTNAPEQPPVDDFPF